MSEGENNNPQTFKVFSEMSPIRPTRPIFFYVSEESPSPTTEPSGKTKAEISLFKTEDKNGMKKNSLRIDWWSKDFQDLPQQIESIIKWAKENFVDENINEVRIDLLYKNGSFTLPIDFFTNPTKKTALERILKNLPIIIEKKNLFYLSKRVFETVKRDDEFLKLVYAKKDSELTTLIYQHLEHLGFKREDFSPESIDYLERRINTHLNRYKERRKMFDFNVEEALALNEEDIFKKASKIPAIPPENLSLIIGISDNFDEKSVRVDHIISSQAKETGTKGDNWCDFLIKRGENWMRNLLRKVLNGEINLDNPQFDSGYNLIDLGNGYYQVLGGRHRTVIAKILGKEEIKARIFKAIPEIGESRFISPKMIPVLRKRIESGLINGDLRQEPDGTWILTVNGYSNPWVFFEDMEGAKKAFEDLINLLNNQANK